MDNEIKELKKQRDQAQFMLQSVGEYQVSRSLVWRGYLSDKDPFAESSLKVACS